VVGGGLLYQVVERDCSAAAIGDASARRHLIPARGAKLGGSSAFPHDAELTIPLPTNK
jgi:hypothetical protein